jgi:hypothetical protein
MVANGNGLLEIYRPDDFINLFLLFEQMTGEVKCADIF